MASYRKKPVIIEAVQWHRHGDHSSVLRANHGGGVVYSYAAEHGLSPDALGVIETLEGFYIVTPGDWIITGVAGEQYPCKPDIFAQTYEGV